jgi:RNA polymerase sigma-70 factor (ECF subfamily)
MLKEKEKEVIKKLRNGDVHSFDEVFRKFNKRIYFFSVSYLKSKEEAEGIVQEVFLSLWKNRTRIELQSDFQAYLFTITFNAIKKRFRKLERERKHLAAYSLTVSAKEDSSDPEMEYNQLNELLEKSIDQLPGRQKEIFLLSKREGLTAEEIAERLKISKRTVENHLFRAKTFLKNSLVDGRLLSLLFFWMFIK